jgi:hypothetical protein
MPAAGEAFGPGRGGLAPPRSDREHAAWRWTRLSAALENRIDPWRPDVDATVQVAAQLAISEQGHIRYNRD